MFTYWNIIQLLNMMRKTILTYTDAYHTKQLMKFVQAIPVFMENIYVHKWILKRLEGHKNLHLLSAYCRQDFVVNFSWNFSFIPQSNSMQQVLLLLLALLSVAF